MKRFSFLILLTLLQLQLNAQGDVCECVGQTSLYEVEDINLIFPSELIRSNRIKTTRIYLRLRDSEQPIRTYRFNDLGQLTTLDDYNEGIPNHRNKYEYGEQGITKETFYYLDSLGNETNFLTEIKDYHYNQLNHLVLIQTREQGEIVEQDKTEFREFKYDERGRLIRRTWHHYYGEFHPDVRSLSKWEITYINDSTTKTVFLSDGRTILESVSSLNSFGEPSKISHSGAEEIFEYTSSNLISKYVISNQSAFVDECPEQSNYENGYRYDSNNLLVSVEHRYGDVLCELLIKYE